MNKFYYILLVTNLVVFSCAKENNNPQIPETRDNKIIAVIKDKALDDSNSVKTSYDGSGSFTWNSGDKITVQLVGTGTNSGKYDKWTYTADGTAAETTFSADGSYTNYELGDYAFYPKHLCSEAPFDLTYNNDNPISVTLPATTSDYELGSSFLKMIPLIGTKTGANSFDFSTATGVLKLNFSDVPNVGGLRLELTHPTYPLCGTFSVSAQNTILASNYISGNSTRQLRPSGAFTTVYIALPIGTIPAGLNIVLKKTSGEVYANITTKATIEVKRNTIIDLTQPIKAVMSSVSISGTSAAPVANITVNSGEGVAFAVGASEDAALSSLGSATWYNSTQSVSLQESSEPSGSGKLYLAYKVKASDGHVYLRSSIPFYFLSAADALHFCKKHTDGRAATSLGASPTLSGMSITFAASDKPTSSNIMLTEFDGMSCDAAPTTGARFYSVASVSEGLSFSAGTPMYGQYTPSSGFNAINLVFTSVGSFFTYNGTSYRICAGTADNEVWNFCLNRNTGNYYIRNWNEPTYLRDLKTPQGLVYSYFFEAYHYDSYGAY